MEVMATSLNHVFLTFADDADDLNLGRLRAKKDKNQSKYINALVSSPLKEAGRAHFSAQLHMSVQG